LRITVTYIYFKLIIPTEPMIPPWPGFDPATALQFQLSLPTAIPFRTKAYPFEQKRTPSNKSLQREQKSTYRTKVNLTFRTKVYSFEQKSTLSNKSVPLRTKAYPFEQKSTYRTKVKLTFRTKAYSFEQKSFGQSL
jgi:hypothetical protein